MTVGIEAYSCVVGQFASVCVKLLLKKVIKNYLKKNQYAKFKTVKCS